jgi:hypothetical protein
METNKMGALKRIAVNFEDAHHIGDGNGYGYNGGNGNGDGYGNGYGYGY